MTAPHESPTFPEHHNHHRRNGRRIAAWLFAGSLLLVPLVAMQFTSEVNWTGSDFAVAAVLIGGTGLAYEGVVRLTRRPSARLAFAAALAATFFLIWSNLAVGIIGSEQNPINLLYFGVVAIGILGGIRTRFQPAGMRRTLLAMAGGQALIAGLALSGVLGATESSPNEILAGNGFFVALFTGTAWLFHRATTAQR